MILILYPFRKELTPLWDKCYFGEDERNGFAPAFDGKFLLILQYFNQYIVENVQNCALHAPTEKFRKICVNLNVMSVLGSLGYSGISITKLLFNYSKNKFSSTAGLFFKTTLRMACAQRCKV